tara:strand:- start:309 stop:548 length:240 start_codon:yes stop_codon:yes gene_type:complete
LLNKLADRALYELLQMQLQRIHMLQKSLAIESFELMVDSVDTVDQVGLKQRSACYEKKAFHGIDSQQSNSIASVSIRET